MSSNRMMIGCKLNEVHYLKFRVKMTDSESVCTGSHTGSLSGIIMILVARAVINRVKWRRVAFLRLTTMGAQHRVRREIYITRSPLVLAHRCSYILL